ncbi:hypothetical protein [Streptomyces sp. NPDC004376]
MTAGWCSRTVRAAVFAAVCVLFAALGHVMMSGAHVPLWALALGVAVTGAVGWCLAGRERGLPLVVTAVVATQTALHTAFSYAQSGPRHTSPMDVRGMESHDMGSMHMDMGAGSTHSMGHMDMGHMGSGHMAMDHMSMTHMSMSHMDMAHSVPGGGMSSVGMLAAHLLAAFLSGLWLAFGEKAAFRIMRAVSGWLAAPLRLLLGLTVAADPPPTRLPRSDADRVPSLLLVHAITSRGPPSGTAVA